MSEYSMACSCGDLMNCEADSRDEAVEKLQGIMTEETIEAHFAAKHPGDDVPGLEEIHSQISQNLQLAMA